MDYEKKYKEAFACAKDIYDDDATSIFTRTSLELCFPELAESEDEKIRKEIVDFICWATDRGSITKEQREKSNSWLAWLEKQGEQKAVEWSEEDEKMYSRICRSYTSYENRILNAKDLSEDHRNNILEELNEQELWLRDRLKSHYQKQCEYNPYKAVVESIAEMCEKYSSPISSLSDFYDNVKVKCKEAKEYDATFPQKQWKPSEEQIAILMDVASGIKDPLAYGATMGVIIQGLKQLKAL